MIPQKENNKKMIPQKKGSKNDKIILKNNKIMIKNDKIMIKNDKNLEFFNIFVKIPKFHPKKNRNWTDRKITEILKSRKISTNRGTPKKDQEKQKKEKSKKIKENY